MRAAVFDEFKWRADDASLLLYGATGAFFYLFLDAGDGVSADDGKALIFDIVGRRKLVGLNGAVHGRCLPLRDPMSPNIDRSLCLPHRQRMFYVTYLCETLLMLPSEEHRPRNPPRVLALQEERFGLAVLEAEDLTVATNVKLALS